MSVGNQSVGNRTDIRWRSQRPGRPRSAPGIRLVATGAQARPAWEEIAARNPDLAICHQPVWMDCMHEVGGHIDAARLYETRDGRRLLLPLAGRPLPPGLPLLYDSWPRYWEGARDSGGLLSADGPITAEDVREVAADLARMPALRVRVVPSTADATAWAAGAPDSIPRVPLHAQVVDLTGGFDVVWTRRFSKKTREKSRKAERRGVVVESDSTGRLLPVFDALYQRSVDNWAAAHFLPTPLARRVIEGRHDHAKLTVVARRLGERCTVWIAWSQGEPVSGIVVLGQGPAATYWKGATDKDLVRASGATDYLHTCAIRAACEAGRTRYDLGTSGLDSLTRFKAGLGAQLHRYQSYSFERIPLTPAQELLRVGLRRAFTAAAAGRLAVRTRLAAG